MDINVYFSKELFQFVFWILIGLLQLLLFFYLDICLGEQCSFHKKILLENILRWQAFSIIELI